MIVRCDELADDAPPRAEPRAPRAEPAPVPAAPLAPPPKLPRHEYEVIICHMNVIRFFVMRALQLPPEASLSQLLLEILGGRRVHREMCLCRRANNFAQMKFTDEIHIPFHFISFRFISVHVQPTLLVSNQWSV